MYMSSGEHHSMIIFKRMEILICLNHKMHSTLSMMSPFSCTPLLMWTEAVQAVNHMDEYKRVVYHFNICMLVPYITKQDIIQKFNRNVIYYNNMKANLNITWVFILHISRDSTTVSHSKGFDSFTSSYNGHVV